MFEPIKLYKRQIKLQYLPEPRLGSEPRPTADVRRLTMMDGSYDQDYAEDCVGVLLAEHDCGYYDTCNALSLMQSRPDAALKTFLEPFEFVEIAHKVKVCVDRDGCWSVDVPLPAMYNCFKAGEYDTLASLACDEPYRIKKYLADYFDGCLSDAYYEGQNPSEYGSYGQIDFEFVMRLTSIATILELLSESIPEQVVLTPEQIVFVEQHEQDKMALLAELQAAVESGTLSTFLNWPEPDTNKEI